MVVDPNLPDLLDPSACVVCVLHDRSETKLLHGQVPREIRVPLPFLDERPCLRNQVVVGGETLGIAENVAQETFERRALLLEGDDITESKMTRKCEFLMGEQGD